MVTLFLNRRISVICHRFVFCLIFANNLIKEVVKQMEDWTVEDPSPQMGSVTEVRVRPKVLYLWSKGTNEDPIDSNINGFCLYNKLGSFRINGNQEYKENDCQPNLIKEWIDLELIPKMGINLMDGFEKSSLIRDYKSYKGLKWRYFLNWIKRYGGLDNNSKSSPQFIAFGGLFTSLMSTPNRFESWSLLVTKFNDCIFMNKIRKTSGHFGGTDRQNGTQSEGPADKNAFFASKMTQIMTRHKSRSNEEEVVNEYEKFFSCYERQIGNHRLVLMSELDAIDDEGNQYEIKCAKDLDFGRKLFNWWSHCVVADIEYIVIGLINSEKVLRSVHKLKVEDLPQMSSFRWSIEKSFDFVNRFLIYIKEILEDSSDLEVFKVWFNKSDNCVKSTRLAANHFIPDWFTGLSAEEPDFNPIYSE